MIGYQAWKKKEEKFSRKTQQSEGESQDSHHMTQVEGVKTETSSMRQARGMARKE